MTVVEPEVLVLDGGLRLVHIHQRSAGAGIFGLTVRAGSADECHGEEGLAHLWSTRSSKAQPVVRRGI